jgi:hypothetical protein
MHRFYRLASAMALIAMGTAATAQSTNTLSDSRMRGSRVQAGIVIPLGSTGSSAERAPRLEMWSERESLRDRAEVRLRTDGDGVYGPPNRLGVTLASNPRMMVNGQQVPGQADRRNISALGVVGIVAGVAVILVGAAVLGAFGSFST